MKREWSAEELAEHWTLSPDERELLANKTGATRLGFAVLLKFFQVESRFPRLSHEVPGAAAEYLAGQIGVPAAEWSQYDWDSRAAKYHRTQIRTQLGFREATVEDGESLAVWLDGHVLRQDRQLERLRASLVERCRTLHIEPPTLDRLDRLIRSAIHQHEEKFSNALLARLSAETQTQLKLCCCRPSPSMSSRRSENQAEPCFRNCGPIPVRPAWRVFEKRLPSWNGSAPSRRKC